MKQILHFEKQWPDSDLTYTYINQKYFPLKSVELNQYKSVKSESGSLIARIFLCASRNLTHSDFDPKAKYHKSIIFLFLYFKVIKASMVTYTSSQDRYATGVNSSNPSTFTELC